MTYFSFLRLYNEIFYECVRNVTNGYFKNVNFATLLQNLPIAMLMLFLSYKICFEIQKEEFYMKKIALSLVAVSAIVTTSGFAADSLEGAFKEGKVSGQVRAFYINRDYTFADSTGAVTTNKSNDRDGLALGGKIAYESGSLYGISAGVAFYTTNKIDGESKVAGHNDKTLFDVNDNGYTFLGQAYLQGKYGKTTVKVGNQQLDTPLAGSDDARMVPNLFTAAVVINSDLPDTTLIGARVTQIAYGSFANAYASSSTTATSAVAQNAAAELSLVSGYGNRTYLTGLTSNSFNTNYKNGKFQSLGKAALGDSAKSTGVTAVAAINKSIKNLTVQVWDYNAEDILNAVYAQADYSWKCLLNPNATMTASVQYIKEFDQYAAANLSSAPFYGVQLAAKAGNLNASAAYSTLGKDNKAAYKGDIIAPWGGVPAFTQGMVTRHQFFADTTAYKLSAGYNLKDVVGQDITASAYYASFDVGTTNSYTQKVTTTEPGFDVIYNNAGIKNLQLRLRGNFPTDFRKNTTTSETTSWSEYRVIANYNF